LTNNTENLASTVQETGYRGLFRVTKIPSCAVSLMDLLKLYTELSEKTSEALEKHLETLPQQHQSLEEFEKIKERLRKIGKLTIMVIGSKGEQIGDTSSEVLNQQRLPDAISMITFDSSLALTLALKHYNVVLSNRFKLTLDFRESPPVFGAYNPWEQPTPNASLLEVTGPDRTWVTAVHETILSFFRERAKHHGWLHSHITFIALNWLIGLPGALWVVYRIDSYFSSALSSLHGALRVGMYVYLVLLLLLVFRVIVIGFRWTFPLLEIEGVKTKRARGIVTTILASLLLALLYDVLKTLLWG
jgi:hypothetical protein